MKSWIVTVRFRSPRNILVSVGRFQVHAMGQNDARHQVEKLLEQPGRTVGVHFTTDDLIQEGFLS